MDTQRIIEAISELKENYVTPQMKEIYNKIYQEVCNVDPERFVSKITVMESTEVNGFCLKLNEQAHQVVVAVMKEIGVPETQIPMIWLSARSAAKAPQVKLCNQQNYVVPTKELSQQEATQNTVPPVGKWLMLTGAAVEVIAWIFLPSVKVWAPIVKGIGLLLLGVGTYRVVQENAANSRIKPSDEAIKAAQKESEKAIRRVCKEQCNLNAEIYRQWLDEISYGIIAECTKLG